MLSRVGRRSTVSRDGAGEQPKSKYGFGCQLRIRRPELALFDAQEMGLQVQEKAECASSSAVRTVCTGAYGNQIEYAEE